MFSLEEKRGCRGSWRGFRRLAQKLETWGPQFLSISYNKKTKRNGIVKASLVPKHKIIKKIMCV